MPNVRCRKLLVLSILIALALATGVWTYKHVDTAPAAAGAAGLTFNITSYEAGTIKGYGNPTISHVFLFRNASPKPVTINDVKVTCACTRATPSKFTVMPGELAELTAEMRVTSLGENVAEIALFTDADTEPIRLRLSANFLPDAFASSVPAQVQLNGATSESVRVNVFSMAEPPPAISHIVPSNPNLHAAVSSHSRGEWRVGPGYTHMIYELTVGTGGLTTDGLDGELVVHFSSTSVPPLRIPIAVRQKAEYEIAPSKVMFIVCPFREPHRLAREWAD